MAGLSFSLNFDILLDMQKFQAEDVKINKVWAAIAYVWIISLVVLLAKKDSTFAQAHARQGFVLFIVSLAASFVPILGWLANLAIWGVAIVALIRAARGEFWEIPVVATLAEKISF